MHQLTPLRKEAGNLRRRPATTTTRAVYHQRAPHVKYHPQIIPGRYDRTPPRPPECRDDAALPREEADPYHAAALALLLSLLALQSGGLAPRQRGATWERVSRWTGEIIDSRHTTEAA